jgi:DNA-binding HxlR family transcriptional regulator
MKAVDKTIEESCANFSNPEGTKMMILPVRDALDILSGKWKLQILFTLISQGKLRYKQIEREVPGLTPKMLSKELKELEINELVIRHAHDKFPVAVEYELTDYGKTLRPLIGELYKWGMNHRERIIGRK